MNRTNWVKLIVSIVAAEGIGALGSVFTIPNIPAWYAYLQKPRLTPPAWVFGPVWTLLFLLMGVAAFLVWRWGLKESRVKIGLAVFAVQLLLNVLWSYLFFGRRDPMAAFVELIFFWLAIATTLFLFAKVSKPAAWLLVPYLCWVTFAGYLNFSIAQLMAAANSHPGVELPRNYTLDHYTIFEVTDQACSIDSDCETPMQYQLQSRCPFTSLCLNKKCAVVCPDYRSYPQATK